jgi:hypothetical protein
MSFNNLSNISLRNLNNHILQISLSPNEIAYLKIIINERPTIFIKILSNINKIIYDNTIYLQDIPQIILVLSDIYKSNIIEEILPGVDLINIIEYTINSIVDSKLFYLQEDSDIVKLLVDSSIELLRIKILIIEKEEKEEKKEEEVKYCCFLI